MTDSETVRGGRLGFFVVLALGVACFVTQASLSAAAERTRQVALIWVETVEDRALVERVRGQVSDLELELLVVEASPTSPRAAPAGMHPFAVVWFTREQRTLDKIVVHVAAGSGTSERTLVRELGNGAPAPDEKLGSATLEAAALVVREALRELAESQRSSPTVPPLPPEPAAPLADEPPPSSAARDESAARAHFRAELTWELVLDGVGTAPRTGPGFRLGAEYRSFELLALAASSLPVTEEDAYGASRLRRYSFGLRIGYEWRPARLFTLGAGALGGVALYSRSVQELDPVVTGASDQVSVSALFGPELRAGFAPGEGPIEVGLTVGLNVVPAAPRVGYEIDGRFTPSFVFWRVQPVFGLGVKFLADRLP